VAGPAGAHVLIRWRLHGAAHKADGGRPDALERAEALLDAPEAPGTECSLIRSHEEDYVAHVYQYFRVSDLLSR